MVINFKLQLDLPVVVINYVINNIVIKFCYTTQNALYYCLHFIKLYQYICNSYL